jgi:hypothetical protein
MKYKKMEEEINKVENIKIKRKIRIKKIRK